jgi:protein ImuB
VAALRRIACLLLGGGDYGGAPQAAAELLEVALAHSPRVEEAGTGLVYLDVAGLGGLFGGEEQIGRHLVRGAAERGLDIRVGIAGSRISARLAARRGDGVGIVEPGTDAECLASAPLSLLDLSDEVATRLGLWGIRTLGELAALPATAVFERLGGEGARLQRLSRGDDPRPLRPWTPPLVFEDMIEPGWEVETLESLGELLTTLIQRVCDKLTRRGLSADRFHWTCRLADRTLHEGSCVPAVPLNEPAAVAALLKASLQSRPPRGPVEAVTLRAYPVRVAPAQESLTERCRPSPRMLAATLAGVTGLLGGEHIGVAVVLDSHRPDAVKLAPLSLSASRREPTVADSPRAVLALRRLRPPCPAGVTLTAGRPVHLRSDRLTARIVASVGPWRSSGEWWTARPWMQDEWDVELGDGTLCRLAHDGSAWWLDGIYD